MAETAYTAFAGIRLAVTARLVVRRVRYDNPAGQDELLPGFRCHRLAHRYHALLTGLDQDKGRARHSNDALAGRDATSMRRNLSG
ncbi:MAG: hypothetical protein ACRDUV_18655 [Pseudonocardiaceae bacterium]